MHITDCCFDLYGTLIEIRTDEQKPEIWKAVREYILIRRPDCGLSAAEMGAFFFRRLGETERQTGRSKCPGEYPEIDIGPVFADLLDRCGTGFTEADTARTAEIFRAASTEKCRLYPGAKDFLRALKSSGIRVWLVSNAQRLFTLPELERLGIRELFDGVCISSDLGFKKPDRRIFEAVLRKHRIAPAHAVMIGNDGKSDIAGAKRLGMKTVYFRTDCSPADDAPEADLMLDGADYEAALAWITEKSGGMPH